MPRRLIPCLCLLVLPLFLSSCLLTESEPLAKPAEVKPAKTEAVKAEGKPMAEPKDSLKSLSFEQATTPSKLVRFSARASDLRWAKDGIHLERGRGKNRELIHPLTSEPGKAGEAPAALEPSDSFVRDALKAFLEKRDGAMNYDFKGRKRISRSTDGESLVIEFKNDLYSYHVDRDIVQLTKDPKTKLRMWEISPNGQWVCVIQNFNLYLIQTSDGKTHQITSDGSKTHFVGVLDWVYQEEIYGRGRWKAFWWGPNSDSVAFLSLDDEEVPSHPIVHEQRMMPRVDYTSYPKPGEPNPKAKLGLASIDGSLAWADLSAYPEDILLVNVQWKPDGKKVFLQIQDRIQSWLKLLEVNCQNAASKVLIEEKSIGWTNRLPAARWLADDSFLWFSERTGIKHIYRYSGNGEFLNAVTAGDWPVGNILRVDEKSQRLYYSGKNKSAIENHAYRVQLDGSELVHLTKDSGSHRISLNHDGSLLLDHFSSVVQPPELRLINDQGELLRVLGRAEIGELKDYAYSYPSNHLIKARDGESLDVQLIRPRFLDKSKKYPIWISTYSGPNAPSVRNRWSSSSWSQFLAQQGFLVLSVNVRSASARGQKYTAACHKQLGVQELKDIEDAIDWLCENEWADRSRVGISGWSYGGFMAAFAATHSDYFKLAVAGAGVYDWRLYDSVYTERYMQTPQMNPEGYDQTSCVKAAAQLQAELVLVHGAVDDNVHTQNLVHFVNALQSAGKDFDLMLYPGSAHGLRGHQRLHYRKLMWKAMQEHLLNPDNLQGMN